MADALTSEELIQRRRDEQAAYQPTHPDGTPYDPSLDPMGDRFNRKIEWADPGKRLTPGNAFWLRDFTPEQRYTAYSWAYLHALDAIKNGTVETMTDEEVLVLGWVAGDQEAIDIGKGLMEAEGMGHVHDMMYGNGWQDLNGYQGYDIPKMNADKEQQYPMPSYAGDMEVALWNAGIDPSIWDHQVVGTPQATYDHYATIEATLAAQAARRLSGTTEREMQPLTPDLFGEAASHSFAEGSADEYLANLKSNVTNIAVDTSFIGTLLKPVIAATGGMLGWAGVGRRAAGAPLKQVSTGVPGARVQGAPSSAQLRSGQYQAGPSGAVGPAYLFAEGVNAVGAGANVAKTIGGGANILGRAWAGVSSPRWATAKINLGATGATMAARTIWAFVSPYEDESKKEEEFFGQYVRGYQERKAVAARNNEEFIKDPDMEALIIRSEGGEIPDAPATELSQPVSRDVGSRAGSKTLNKEAKFVNIEGGQ